MKLTEIEDKLPNHPADLIRLAVQELKKHTGSGLVKPDMTRWLLLYKEDGSEATPCSVCLAGAIMLGLCHLSVYKIHLEKGIIGEQVMPRDFKESLCKKLLAIDYFRSGRIDEGLYNLGYDKPNNFCIKNIVKTSTNFGGLDPDNMDGFFTSLEKLALEFERTIPKCITNNT